MSKMIDISLLAFFFLPVGAAVWFLKVEIHPAGLVSRGDSFTSLCVDPGCGRPGQPDIQLLNDFTSTLHVKSTF